MTAFAVYNPRAGNGRTGRQWRAIDAALETVFPLHVHAISHAPGHVAELVREALQDGHLDIVVVGGDGTVNEAVNGFLAGGAPLSPDAVLSIVATGVNNDFCRALALEPGVEAALPRLARARIRKFDVGYVSCLSHSGMPVSRYFLGAASFGLSGRMALGFNRARIAKFFGTRFAHAFHMRLALMRWRASRVRLIADDDYDEIAGIASVVLANASYFSEGLRMAPDALPDDGQFDLAVLSGARRSRMLAVMQAAGRGEMPGDADVRRRRTSNLTAAPTVETRGPVYIETDGESVGVLPAHFHILHGAIRIRA